MFYSDMMVFILYNFNAQIMRYAGVCSCEHIRPPCRYSCRCLEFSLKLNMQMLERRVSPFVSHQTLFRGVNTASVLAALTDSHSMSTSSKENVLTVDLL